VSAVDAAPFLEIVDVHKSFGGIHAVQGLTMKLFRHRVTGLIGPNGAGKTTVFNLATGFLRPDRGRVVCKGVDITGWPPWRSAGLGISRTFQEVRVFGGMSVLENVMLAPAGQPGESVFRLAISPRAVRRREEENLERCLDVLDTVSLRSKALVLAEDLSYAEKKLLSIARALARDAECLLLDEPMSGLDEETLAFTLQLIRRLARDGRSVCLIEHNSDFVRDACDHTIFLEQGRVLAEGAPADIMADQQLADLYFGT
jgi:branched-chain amino acid transport system ATP-binding protein/branched-chain amino acid transport system permease protein